MSKKLLIKSLMLLIIPFGQINAQSAVLASGITASGSGGSTSYSVGQLAYQQKGINFRVLEGVQQTYEILTLAVDDDSVGQKNILLYPNPVQDFIIVDFGDNHFQDSRYVLFDSQGKLIKKGSLIQQKTELDLSILPTSVYIIQIFQKEENIKTFKIIKK